MSTTRPRRRSCRSSPCGRSRRRRLRRGLGVGRAIELAGTDAQVVLIGHSMGGLVARHLLTNPPVDDVPFGVPERTRDDIDRIRDRTLYLITLGTPHEGSQAADRATPLARVDRIVVDETVRPNAFGRR